MRKGFTLIEVSVVLVIIGLLVSGIVVGQSLVRASQVQTIIQDVATFQSAITQFRQKYSAIPGDMANAQDYWGVNPNCGAGTAGPGILTCNGDGDGRINHINFAPYEQFLVWQHLSDAGFITGQYTGGLSTGLLSSYYCTGGLNCPGGKVSPAQAYYLQFMPGAIGLNTAYFWDQAPGNYLIVGATKKGSGAYAAYPLLSAPEALALDSKVDDGKPGMGNWKSMEATGGAGFLPNCVVTSGTSNPPADGTVASQPGSVYNVGYGDSLACSFEINLNF